MLGIAPATRMPAALAEDTAAGVFHGGAPLRVGAEAPGGLVVNVRGGLAARHLLGGDRRPEEPVKS